MQFIAMRQSVFHTCTVLQKNIRTPNENILNERGGQIQISKRKPGNKYF